jgi:hypothetical protein
MSDMNALLALLSDPKALSRHVKELQAATIAAEESHNALIDRQKDLDERTAAVDTRHDEATKRLQYASEAEAREEQKRRDNIIRTEQLDARQKNLDEREVAVKTREDRMDAHQSALAAKLRELVG